MRGGEVESQWQLIRVKFSMVESVGPFCHYSTFLKFICYNICLLLKLQFLHPDDQYFHSSSHRPPKFYSTHVWERTSPEMYNHQAFSIRASRLISPRVFHAISRRWHAQTIVSQDSIKSVISLLIKNDSCQHCKFIRQLKRVDKTCLPVMKKLWK